VAGKDSDPVIEVRAKLKGRVTPIEPAIVSGELRGGRLNVGTKQVAFEGAHAVDVDLSGITFDIFSVRESTFERCDFRRFKSAKTVPSFGKQAPRQTVYRECRFDDADLRHPLLGEARFERCVFDGAKIERWLSTHAEFIDCHFAGKVDSCNFFGHPPDLSTYVRQTPGHERRNEFRGNDFREAVISNTGFVCGIDVSAQRWPQGPEYIRLDRFQERLTRARKAVLTWPDDSEREPALRMLHQYSAYGFEEQREIFTRRDDLRAIPRKVRERLWDLLEHALVGAGFSQ
jgi:uncharacterized protein YjbI with pentapeptide repeats